MKRTIRTPSFLTPSFLPAAALVVGTVLLASSGSVSAKAKAKPGRAEIKRGAYLVTVGGCNDCHTPWKMGQNGPEPDLTRLLSGHSQDLAMPPGPTLPPGPWMATVSGTMTAWSGPWGTSFTANLTPDKETGLGTWTRQNFIDTLRNGKHLGRGRPLLPPMPWQNFGQMTDADLGAVFAYLQSIPAVRNRVPDPVVPAVIGQR